MNVKSGLLSDGDPAPAVEATTATGEVFSLAALKGHWVVVFFYPKANTPGWAHESKDFQQHLAQLESLNAHVVGISADKPESQLKFIDKYALTYPMVPNPGKDIIRSFGVPFALGLAAQRTTFLVDPEGQIARVWPKVSVKGHADDVVEAIRQLSAA